MRDTPEVLRVCLLATRVALWVSSVIVMGLTAWAVTHLKGYRTVFTLVIVSICLFDFQNSTALLYRRRLMAPI